MQAQSHEETAPRPPQVLPVLVAVPHRAAIAAFPLLLLALAPGRAAEKKPQAWGTLGFQDCAARMMRGHEGNGIGYATADQIERRLLRMETLCRKAER
jgi:hypothetical protein